jgi:hypothetical protein
MLSRSTILATTAKFDSGGAKAGDEVGQFLLVDARPE